MHRILQNYVWLYFMKDKLIDHVSDAGRNAKGCSVKSSHFDADRADGTYDRKLQGDSGVFGITDPRTDWEW